jgi:hypothetical protein
MLFKIVYMGACIHLGGISQVHRVLRQQQLANSTNRTVVIIQRRTRPNKVGTVPVIGLEKTRRRRDEREVHRNIGGGIQEGERLLEESEPENNV